jgi:hypothetical protein
LPPDLREDVCEHNRRHRPTKDGEEGDEAGAGSAEGTNNVGERHVLPRVQGAGVLTSGLAASIPPVEVYTGPVRDNIATSNSSVAPTPKNLLATAAKPAFGKRLSLFRRQHLWRLREHSR